MTKDYARDFWKKHLQVISRDGSAAAVENPACEFTKRAKAGEYDSLTDEEYNIALKNVEQIRTLWDSLPRRTVGEILLDALGKTKVYGDHLEKIADLLADCSLCSDYSPAQRKSDLDAIREAQRERAIFNMEFDEFWTPREIYNSCVSERIQGQEEAKRAAAMIVYNHVEGRRSNTIFCGPSGCGKSEI